MSRSSSSSAPFGLSWGASHDGVTERFAGVVPIEQDAGSIVLPLSGVAERLWTEGAFCPSALLAGPERSGDVVDFSFVMDRLVGVLVRFGYGFEVIGQDADTLSESAMAAYARTELQQLLLEFSARYGAPSLFSDQQMRSANRHFVGAALYLADDGGSMQAVFGHDGGELVGELRYQALGSEDGF